MVADVVGDRQHFTAVSRVESVAGLIPKSRAVGCLITARKISATRCSPYDNWVNGRARLLDKPTTSSQRSAAWNLGEAWLLIQPD